MTPLQKVAMGLVIVFVRAPFGGYDALADPIGWVLAIAGLLALRDRLPHGGLALGLGVLAGVVSAVLFVPAAAGALEPSAQWALSLPQTMCCVVLCHSLAQVAEPAPASRFAMLRWVFGALAVAPVLVYGGGVDALATPVGILAVATNVYFIYLLFKISKRAFVRP